MVETKERDQIHIDTTHHSDKEQLKGSAAGSEKRRLQKQERDGAGHLSQSYKEGEE